MEDKLRLLQLMAFNAGPALAVVQHFFEFKVTSPGSNLEQYLNNHQNKHILFHSHYPTRYCCSCKPTPLEAPLTSLDKKQYNLLFDENGSINAAHEIKTGQKTTQYCLCKVSAKQSIKVTDLDITLLNAIIQNCCKLPMRTQISRWMTDIKDVRNTLAHHGTGTFDKTQFEHYWKKLKTATLLCAGDTGQTSLKLFQTAVDQITTCSVDDLGKRIVQTTNKLSQVQEDLNGISPQLKSLCDQHVQVNTEVKTTIERIEERMEENMGTLKHMLSEIQFQISMKIQPQEMQEEVLPEQDKAGKKRNLSIEVDAFSSSWDEDKTTSNLAEEVQGTPGHPFNSEQFRLEKVEKRCIYLELTASPEVFKSPQNLQKAIKTLISQFVKAGELDKNVPSTVNISITVKSSLSKEVLTSGLMIPSGNKNFTSNGIDPVVVNTSKLIIDTRTRVSSTKDSSVTLE